MSEKGDGCLVRLLRWANFLLIIFTGISFAAPYFSPTPFWPFIFLGMGFPILIMLNIFCVLFWLYIKKWYFIFSLMCLMMSWSGAGKFIGNPFKSIDEVEGTSIKVMTYNTQSGNIHMNKTYEEFIELISSSNPDIICFQEINIEYKTFKTVLEKYPHYCERPGQSILSKYPMEKFGDLKLEKIRTGNGTLWADINIEGEKIRVYNLHLHSNKITSEVNELSENIGLDELNDKENWTVTKGILSQVKHAAKIRAEQSITVKKSINASPYPVVICGDFNDPPQSYTYRKLSENLKDTFIEAGKGLGFTFNGNIPFLKIDYIFVSPEIHVSSTKNISSKLSDHKPVVSMLVLPIK